jgi:hypothetical protein
MHVHELCCNRTVCINVDITFKYIRLKDVFPLNE